MAFTVGSTLAKDSGGTAIAGGLLSADVAGGGVGPTFLFQGLVDGVAGSNKAQIDSSNRIAVQIAAAAAAIAKAEDAASADADVGVPAMAVRKATPANTSGTDGDYEMLNILAGRLFVRGEPRMFSVAGTVLTRPANVTAYAANDSISDNATAGSVTALPITLSDTNDDPISIERLRLTTADTGIAGKNVRAWIYNSDPTAGSGVVGGDNAAFANKRAGFIGTMSGLFRAMNDGSVVCLVPDEGARITVLPGSGAKTVWYQLQAIDAFTPSANSTTFTPTMEGYQGRA